MKKIFIVGCPRSGTTLLQSFLASHSEIVSFPETHIFSNTIHINSLIRFFTVYNRKHLKKLNQIRTDFGLSAVSDISPPVIGTDEWTKFLLQTLDEIGEQFKSGRESFLLEKTPRHLHYLDLIERAEPDALFIHMIRNGKDVVASLMEASGENPQGWSGSRSLKKSVFWWNRSIKLSRKYIGKNGHLHVRYENLVSNTEEVLQRICSFANLEYENEMLTGFSQVADTLINEGENWKDKNRTSTISNTSKFDRLPEKMQYKIITGLLNFDYSSIDINKSATLR